MEIMTLDKINVRAYLQYLFPDKTDAFIDEISERWKKESEAQTRDLSTHFIHLNSSGKIIAALRTESTANKEFRIILPTTMLKSDNILSTALNNLIEEAVFNLRKKDASRISFRVMEISSLSFLSDTLGKLEFSLDNSRVEYQTQVCDLPEKKHTPFVWVNVSEGTPFDVKYAATMLETAGDGNPEWGHLEQNIEVLNEYLSDTEFISDPKNLQIGFIENEAAGIILTQVIKEGWCTIAYMGLLPAYRGRGLGQWIHQRGFQILKDLDGVTYHGGTASKNLKMRALFAKHGCEEFRTMQEWELWLC